MVLNYLHAHASGAMQKPPKKNKKQKNGMRMDLKRILDWETGMWNYIGDCGGQRKAAFFCGSTGLACLDNVHCTFHNVYVA